MFEFMLGAIAAILFGIIANSLTPFFQNLFKIGSIEPQHDKPKDEVEPQPEKHQAPNRLEEWRAKNREKLANDTNRILLYLFPYVAMFLSVYAPIMLHGGLFSPSVNLAESRLAIDYIIDETNLSLISAVFGFFLFLPFWEISHVIAMLIAKKLSEYKKIDEIRLLAFISLVMIFWAFFIAGNVSWILNISATWLDSIKTSLLIWVLLSLAAFAQK